MRGESGVGGMQGADGSRKRPERRLYDPRFCRGQGRRGGERGRREGGGERGEKGSGVVRVLSISVRFCVG